MPPARRETTIARQPRSQTRGSIVIAAQMANAERPSSAGPCELGDLQRKSAGEALCRRKSRGAEVPLSVLQASHGGQSERVFGCGPGLRISPDDSYFFLPEPELLQVRLQRAPDPLEKPRAWRQLRIPDCSATDLQSRTEEGKWRSEDYERLIVRNRERK